MFVLIGNSLGKSDSYTTLILALFLELRLAWKCDECKCWKNVNILFVNQIEPVENCFLPLLVLYPFSKIVFSGKVINWNKFISSHSPIHCFEFQSEIKSGYRSILFNLSTIDFISDFQKPFSLYYLAPGITNKKVFDLYNQQQKSAITLKADPS